MGSIQAPRSLSRGIGITCPQGHWYNIRVILLMKTEVSVENLRYENLLNVYALLELAVLHDNLLQRDDDLIVVL